MAHFYTLLLLWTLWAPILFGSDIPSEKEEPHPPVYYSRIIKDVHFSELSEGWNRFDRVDLLLDKSLPQDTGAMLIEMEPNNWVEQSFETVARRPDNGMALEKDEPTFVVSYIVRSKFNFLSKNALVGKLVRLYLNENVPSPYRPVKLKDKDFSDTDAGETLMPTSLEALDGGELTQSSLTLLIIMRGRYIHVPLQKISQADKFNFNARWRIPELRILPGDFKKGMKAFVN